MANKGALFLDNSSVISLYEQIKTFQEQAIEAFYSQYKNSFKLSVSNYYKGTSADAFKNYMTNGEINIITSFMEVLSEMLMMMQFIAELFFQYESSHAGKIEEATLDSVTNTLSSKEQTFDNEKNELDTVLKQASEYISVIPLSTDSVDAGYAAVRTALQGIREGLYAVDGEALNSANELYERIQTLKNLIEKTMGHCYHGRGTIDPDSMGSLSAQGWYTSMGNSALYLKLNEDPFSYSAGEVTLSEDQWAAGLCSDVFAYAGYSVLSASYEAGNDGGAVYAKAKASLLSANGYAQFTDYLSGSVTAKVGFAEGDVKAGFSDDYAGFHVNGEVGLVDVEGKVVLGSEDFNAFVKGEAKVLCADGKAAFEFEDDGEFAIGVDVSATAASAKIKGGLSFLSYKDPDSATGENKNLFGIDAGVKADAGGSFAVWAESETAIETDFVNINALSVKVDAAFLLGVDVAVTIPFPYFKWPW